MRSILTIAMVIGIAAPLFLPAQSQLAPAHFDKDLPITITRLTWDIPSSQWDSIQFRQITWGIDSLPVLEFVYIYNNGFVPETRRTPSFNAAKQLTSDLYEHWINNAWENTTRHSQTFDAQGNTDLMAHLAWNGTAWDTSSATRYDNVYNGLNQRIQRTTMLRNNSTMAYEPNARENYTYDALGQQDSLIAYAYYGNTWVPIVSFQYYGWHDYARHLVDSASTMLFDTTSNQWFLYKTLGCQYGPLEASTCVEFYLQPFGSQVDFRITNVTDDHGHPILGTQEYGANPPLTLVSQQMWNNTYDGLGRMLERTLLDLDSAVFVPVYRDVFAYASGSTAIQPAPAIQVGIGPNPAQEEVHIQLPEGLQGPVVFQLHDLQGRLRIHAQLANSTELQHVWLSETLAAGTYLYKVETQAGSAGGRLEILR